MTLKEKVALVCPDNLDEGNYGGVFGCPSGYDFLNVNEHCGIEPDKERCARCWNREWHDPEEPATEAIDHPAHYNRFKHECIDEMVAMFGVEAVKAFCRCNIYKYRYRCGAKGGTKEGAEDLKKSEWYMDKLMELERQGNDCSGNVVLL